MIRTLFFLSIFLSHFFLSSLGSCLCPLENQPLPEKTKVVLITGASRGIGWETAKMLASQGHHVYASMRSPQFFEEQKNLPSSLQLVELDVTQEASIANVLATIRQKEGRLDVLINNAGCAVFGPVEMVTIEQAKRVFEVNFFGTMRLMQAALPLMREQGKGLIINMSSTSGIRPSPGWDIYAASKFALEGLSEAVAALARQWNVHVVMVEPGATSTQFMQQSTEIGSRRTPQTAVYDAFMPHALQWMTQRLAEGQPPQEVAGVIASIIASDHYQLCYQTSLKGTETVAKRLCDPTGEKSLQEQELLIKQLWKGPLSIHSGSSYR